MNSPQMAAPDASLHEHDVPLCVDLDGTLIRTDVLWESFIVLLKRNPFYFVLIPFWWMRGRAFLKQQIASRVELNPASLPYNAAFLDYLREERRKGRKLILVTAADGKLARQIAAHLGLFADVIASDGKTNLRGRQKGLALAERYGKGRFDYAGNSSVDLPVWEQSRAAIVVNAGAGLAGRARRLAHVSREFPRSLPLLRAFLAALRPHQWVKNLIVLVPLLTAHKLGDRALLARAFIAMAAFCACASGVYVLNDLLDLEADRAHSQKCRRPFASGELPLPAGLIAAPALLLVAFALGWRLSLGFIEILALYAVLTTSYSLRVKQVALLDVFFLAGLYTIRLIGGHAATGVKYSFWLLAFSMFLFLSLALVKRYTELRVLRRQNLHKSGGRGYTVADLEFVAILGVASGYLSVLVMALYVNSNEVRALYEFPSALLLMCPLLLYWISRVWLIAHRGDMHDDPIVFALKDGVSYLIGALVLFILWIATGHYAAVENLFKDG